MSSAVPREQTRFETARVIAVDQQLGRLGEHAVLAAAYSAKHLLVRADEEEAQIELFIGTADLRQ